MKNDTRSSTKRQEWQRIQTETPELAEFLVELAKTFGKMEKVKVTRWPKK
jgi:hypothetical protein